MAHTYVCDCSSREDIYRVAAKVQSEVGPVDILVNNAGILCGKKLLNLKDVEIERTIRVNTLAHFWVSPIKQVLLSLLKVQRCIASGDFETFGKLKFLCPPYSGRRQNPLEVAACN